ncbi:MAG: hypothetical protein WD361_12140 [Gracilimonas sp.]
MLSFFSKFQYKELIYYLIPAVILGLSLTACSNDSTSSENGDGNDPTQDYTIEGSADSYDFDENRITPSSNPSLGEGTIKADGSFETTLYGLDEIEDELKTIGDDAFDSFRGFLCEDELMEELDDENRFAQVPAFAFLHGEDNNTGLVGLTSDQIDLNVVGPGNFAGDFHVRWFFSNQELALNLECSEGAERVDLELSAGWNEVIYDISDRESKVLYTGERPNEVEWIVEE